MQCLLLLFLLIFSDNLSGSDELVLFDSLDGNGALFANMNAISQVADKLNLHLWMEA